MQAQINHTTLELVEGDITAMGTDAIVTDRTIDVHLTALRRKLSSARTLIQTVRGVGYRLATESIERQTPA